MHRYVMSVALDPLAIAVDVVSIVALLSALAIGWKTLRNFRQSRQAVTESASLLEVIVHALSSRIESSELVVRNMGEELESITTRTALLESKQSDLQTSYVHVLKHLQDALLNDKRLVLELEQLKSRPSVIERSALGHRIAVTAAKVEAAISSGDLLSPLTPTERETIVILGREGAKDAPWLGRRLKKSREHMARLMKKLYMEGYVDRESNYAPFRYRLSEKVRKNLESGSKPVTAAPSERA